METIIPIKGNVRHSITLDPTVWIFDDRRIDLDEYFTNGYVEKDPLEAYKKAMGKHWSREIMEGSTFPPTLKSEETFEDSKEITGTYGISLSHFLKIADPLENAQTLFIETTDGNSHPFPLSEAKEFIFKFCDEGKPVLEDGPVHVYFKDGSNIDKPIRNVTAIRID
ncbi:peptidyl-prolyl cis-trans isomerase [Filibacter tadaridae]|uniref:Peptidyl-prolyl cis-trans isomerase n=1 Tax=Filibacter tadaridae TaxID=2483811 RepID=A0A3P5X4S8_9BACL|nr:peptidyl-prolyl cis-trans isomerase [Filibacter tadaridae]VDC29884.1 hypothetical protein FILTAD_02436 [Filibacter tadaridae]